MNKFNGKRLKELRNKKGLTAHDLAKSLGVALNTIFQYENGTTTPKKYNVQMLSKILNVKEEYFFENKNVDEYLVAEEFVFPERLKNKISALSLEKQSTLFKMVDELVNIIS